MSQVSTGPWEPARANQKWPRFGINCASFPGEFPAMRWRTRARFAAGAFLAGAFMGANPVLIGAGTTNLFTTRHDTAAIAAQQDIEGFLAHALAGTTNEAAVLIDGAGWVSPVARTGDTLIVRSAGGEFLTVAFADIRDWGFTGADGRLYGNFRARSLLSALPPEDAAGLAATLAETPLPSADPLSPEAGDFSLAARHGSL